MANLVSQRKQPRPTEADRIDYPRSATEEDHSRSALAAKLATGLERPHHAATEDVARNLPEVKSYEPRSFEHNLRATTFVPTMRILRRARRRARFGKQSG
jgi:hypothetical protein